MHTNISCRVNSNRRCCFRHQVLRCLAVPTLAGFGNFDQVICSMIEVQHPIDGHLPVGEQRLDPVPDPGGAVGQEHHLFGSMHLLLQTFSCLFATQENIMTATDCTDRLTFWQEHVTTW